MPIPSQTSRHSRSSSTGSTLPDSDLPSSSGSYNSDNDVGCPPAKKTRYEDLLDVLDRDVKELKSHPATHEHRKLGRWIPRALDLFVEVRKIFQIGRAQRNKRLDKDSEADKPLIHLLWLHNELIRMLPSLDTRLTEIETALPMPDMKKILTLAEIIRDAAQSARAIDTSNLKKMGINFAILDPKKNPYNPPLSTPPLKAELGFNHFTLARALIPIQLYHKLTGPDAEILTEIKEGLQPITADQMPAMMYEDPDSFDEEDEDIGLCRGHLPIRCGRFVYIGPEKAMTGASPQARKSNNATINNCDSVTPQMIAYSSVQARYMISSMDGWQQIDGAFDYKVFYNSIIDLFEMEGAEEWRAETLSWWNRQLFGQDPSAVTTTVTVSAKERILEQHRRKAQQKAAALAQHHRDITAAAMVPAVLGNVDLNVEAPGVATAVLGNGEFNIEVAA